jgi:hypothetical protein
MKNPEIIKNRIERLRIEIKKLRLDYRRALLDRQQWGYGRGIDGQPDSLREPLRGK